MYQTSRKKKKLRNEYSDCYNVPWQDFPESVQVTVHVLQSQQQVGPFWKHSSSNDSRFPSENRIKMQPRISAALQCDQTTRTNTNLSLPFMRLKSGAYAGVHVLNEKRSQWREGMHMTWLDRCGPTGDGGYIRSPMLTPSQRQTGGLSPNEPWPPFARPQPTTTKAAFGKFWSLCDYMTKVKRIINDSNLVLAFSHHISFIHTSYSDEQCITQKYKGKILVLHYTFSKIYTE